MVAFGCRSDAPGTVTVAYFLLFSQLAGELLPIENNIRVAMAHPALILGFNRVVADTHKVKVISPAFDREIAKPLPGSDKGSALLTFHLLCFLDS